MSTPIIPMPEGMQLQVSTDLPLAWPGVICRVLGAHGVTKNGTEMVCRVPSTGGKPRWGAVSPPEKKSRRRGRTVKGAGLERRSIRQWAADAPAADAPLPEHIAEQLNLNQILALRRAAGLTANMTREPRASDVDKLDAAGLVQDGKVTSRGVQVLRDRGELTEANCDPAEAAAFEQRIAEHPVPAPVNRSGGTPVRTGGDVDLDVPEPAEAMPGWEQYDACSTCRAPARRACRNLRRSRGGVLVYNLEPHPGRPRLPADAVPPTLTGPTPEPGTDTITDKFGRVWTRYDSDGLYIHDMLVHPAERISHLGLPSPSLADNPGYADLCAICRSQWPTATPVEPVSVADDDQAEPATVGQVTITCDGECGASFTGEFVGATDVEQRAAARKMMAAQGWRVDTTDLCPACRTKRGTSTLTPRQRADVTRMMGDQSRPTYGNRCNTCGHTTDSIDAFVCPNGCGAIPTNHQGVRCTRCGKTSVNDARDYCTHCGGREEYLIPANVDPAGETLAEGSLTPTQLARITTTPAERVLTDPANASPADVRVALADPTLEPAERRQVEVSAKNLGYDLAANPADPQAAARAAYEMARTSGLGGLTDDEVELALDHPGDDPAFQQVLRGAADDRRRRARSAREQERVDAARAFRTEGSDADLDAAYQAADFGSREREELNRQRYLRGIDDQTLAREAAAATNPFDQEQHSAEIERRRRLYHAAKAAFDWSGYLKCPTAGCDAKPAEPCRDLRSPGGFNHTPHDGRPQHRVLNAEDEAAIARVVEQSHTPGSTVLPRPGTRCNRCRNAFNVDRPASSDVDGVCALCADEMTGRRRSAHEVIMGVPGVAPIQAHETPPDHHLDRLDVGTLQNMAAAEPGSPMSTAAQAALDRRSAPAPAPAPEPPAEPEWTPATAGEPVTGARSTAPVRENTWEVLPNYNDPDEVHYHDDGDIGYAVKRMGDDRLMDVDGQPLANRLGQVATRYVSGKTTGLQQIRELEALRDRLPECRARRELDYVIGELGIPADAPAPAPFPEECTLTPLRRAYDRMMECPLARKQPDKEIAHLVEVARQYAAGRRRGKMLVNDVRMLANRWTHESTEGKFELDRIIVGACADMEAMITSRDEGLRAEMGYGPR